jgi:copper(I)-binding protein
MEFKPNFLSLGAAFIALALVSPVAACAESVKIANAWVRSPVAGQTTAGAYVELTSDRDAALVAVGSPAAGRAELHAMTIEAGVMRMRPLPRIELPAGRSVRLAPGGMHIMLFDLKQPLKSGDKVPLVLSVQPSGPSAGMSLTTLNIEAEVRPVPPSAHSH